MSDPSGDNGDDTVGSTKVAFSLGGKKKKKSSSSKATATAADFGNDTSSTNRMQEAGGSSHGQNQAPLVIPLSQPTQSLLTRIKQEEEEASNDNSGNNNNNSSIGGNADTTVPSTNSHSTGPALPVIASNGSIHNSNHKKSLLQPKPESGSSKDQLQRDLDNLPDATNEESYEHVPVSQFGAALLRGMGWTDEDPAKKSKQPEVMPRPHRLGLGAIPKASMPNNDSNMPSVLSGRRGKKPKKLSVAQLQQQEEFDRKRELQKKQDKQRTLQVGSIIYVDLSSNNNSASQQQQRAKVIQLQGVPGLNMVSVHLEHAVEPSGIKRGQLGELVPRKELEQRPFVLPEERKERRRRDDDVDKDGRDRDRESDRRREKDGSRRRDRSRSRSRERDRDRKRDRKESDQSGRDGGGERRSSRDRSRSRSRDRDDDRRRDREKSRDKDRKRDRDRDDRRKEEKSRKKSRSEKDSKSAKKDDNNNNPLWMIPNIRVRVVTEKLGRRYFRQKGVIVDVTVRHGATLRMDMTDGSSSNHVVLEHVPERYLETALPKSGGQAIALTGPNKWTKGRLLERNSKTSQGSMQVFEDMSIITLSLDDMAEWCGPLDDDLG